MNSSPNRPKRTRKQVDYTAGAIFADDDDFTFASSAKNKGKSVKPSQSSEDDFHQHDQVRPDASGKRSSQQVSSQADDNSPAKKKKTLSLDKTRRTERPNARERKEQEDLRIALELSMTDAAAVTPMISQSPQLDPLPISNVVVADNLERHGEQRELVNSKENVGGGEERELIDNKENMGGGEKQGVDVGRTDECGEVDSGASQGEVKRSQDTAAKKSEASVLTKGLEPDALDASAFSNTPEGELDGVNVVEVEACKSRTTAAPSPSSAAKSAKSKSQAATVPQSEDEQESNDDRDDLKVPIGPLPADDESDSDFLDTKKGRKATKAKPKAKPKAKTKTKVVGKRSPKEGKTVMEDETDDDNIEEVAVKTEGENVVAPRKRGDRKMVTVDVEVVLKRGKRGRPRRQIDSSEKEENDERPCVQEEADQLVDVATKTSRGVRKKEDKLAVDENDDGEFDDVEKNFGEEEDDESDFDKGEAKRKGKKQTEKKALPASSKVALATVKQQMTSNTATIAARPVKLRTKAKSDNMIGVSNGGDAGATKIDVVARTVSLGVGKTAGNDNTATTHVASSTAFAIGHLITNSGPIRVGLSRRNKKLAPLHPYLGHH